MGEFQGNRHEQPWRAHRQSMARTCLARYSPQTKELERLTDMSRAAIMPAPGQPIEIWNLPKPEIEPGGVLLKTLAAEVCGTDVHLWHGKLAGVPYPLLPGHVSVGE